jgi:hypothetical protein
MPILRPLTALLLLGTAANAAAKAPDVEPLISRPLTLPEGRLDLTLHGTYTNWSGGGSSIDGETLAAGIDYGASDKVQLGLAAAFPINPGAGFGSVLGSLAAGGSDNVAVRLDAGYERIGVTGGNVLPGVNSHTDRFFGGIGAPIRIPLSPTVAFVSGRVGAVQFGHFNNLGFNGAGLYLGASGLSQLAADLLVISGGNNNSATSLGINLPAGLLLQPDPHFALTLQTGYSVTIQASGATIVDHYIPLALEAVVSPAQLLDIGARFALDGFVAESGGGGATPGYFDLRSLMFWIRLHV